MQTILLKKPHTVSFSKNPVPFVLAITPYGDVERKQTIRLLLKVLVEKSFGSGAFDEVRSQVFFPDSEGTITADVATIIDPYLGFHTPRPVLASPEICSGQSLRYKIAWLLERDNTPVGSLAESPVFTCLKGGLSFEQWHPTEFFTRVVLSDQRPLNYFAQAAVGPADLRFVYWTYPFATNLAQTVTVAVRGSNGVVYQAALPGTVPGLQWAVYCAPILPALVALPAGVTATEVSVRVSTTAGQVVAHDWRTIEQRNFYKQHALLYRGSTGALETVYLRGQVDYEADYERQSASRSLPPWPYANGNLLSKNVSRSSEGEKWKGDTGFLPERSMEGLRDLLLSSEVYAYKEGRLMPVVVASKNAKFYSNRDNLLSMQVEWSHAHSNSNFTPRGLMPQSRTCPAVENLQVVQLTRDTLQIMYALPAPYDLCEIELNIPGATTVNFFYEGNTRVIRQQFTNPVTTGSLSVQVRGRVVCNPNATPPDKGPFTSVTLQVVGNSAVVANHDSYNIASGFTAPVALPTSVLDNDYDPDGDPLTVVATSGATVKGGTYSIDAQGMIQYKPPTGLFTGEDWFLYTVTEAGGSSAQARATINVGTVATTIYAKAVKRNVTITNGFDMSTENGQYWLEFFSDPACTAPVDVTGKNLTINYQKETVNGPGVSGGNPGVWNLSVAGTGTGVKVYEGQLVLTIGGVARVTTTFKTLPGTGYTPV